MKDDFRCSCCDQPSSDHGPYLAEDCLCKRCAEEWEYVSSLPPEPTWVRAAYVLCLTLTLLAFLGAIALCIF